MSSTSRLTLTVKCGGILGARLRRSHTVGPAGPLLGGRMQRSRATSPSVESHPETQHSRVSLALGCVVGCVLLSRSLEDYCGSSGAKVPEGGRSGRAEQTMHRTTVWGNWFRRRWESVDVIPESRCCITVTSVQFPTRKGHFSVSPCNLSSDDVQRGDITPQ